MNEVESGELRPLFDLRSFLLILWRRKLLILAVTGVLVALAAVYIAVTKPTYTATAVILVDPRETRTTPSENVLSGLGSDSAAIASQLAVIKSRDLLTSVFEAEGLADDPEFSESGLVGGLLANLTGGAERPTQNVMFERFASRVAVEREGLTYVLEISFKSGDPEKAARIVNAIVDHYIRSQVDQKSSANAEVTELLTDRIGGLQQDVRDAERAVEEFKITHGIFDSGSGTTLLQTQIDQLTSLLAAAQEQARQAEARYEQAVAAGTSPAGLERLTQILSSSAADKLRDDYNQRAAAIASAQAVFGPRHPTLISQQAELGRVEGLMVAEAERITSELRAGNDLAAQNVTKIETDIAALRAQLNEANQQAVELRELERNAEASRTVLDQFQKRSEETGQLETLQVSDVRVISSAAPPEQATWPKPTLLLAVSLMLGLAIGGALALLLGLPDTTARVRRSAQPAPEPAEAAPAPVVVVTRPAEAAGMPLSADRSPLVEAVAAEPPRHVLFVAPSPAPAPEPEHASVDEPPGAPAPPTSAVPPLFDFGVLRTRLQPPPAFGPIPRSYLDAARRELTRHPEEAFAGALHPMIRTVLSRLEPHKPPFLLLLSSVGDRFEKSRVAYNLAFGLQRAGASVLMLDLDPPPRGPLDQAEGNHGLLLALTGKAWADPDLLIDRETGLPTIRHQSGGADIAPLGAGETGKLMRDAGRHFEFVLAIGRPLADPGYSPALSEAADQEIIVLNADEADQGVALRLSRQLPVSRRSVHGLVLVEHGVERADIAPAQGRASVQSAAAEIRRASAYAGLA